MSIDQKPKERENFTAFLEMKTCAVPKCVQGHTVATGLEAHVSCHWSASSPSWHRRKTGPAAPVACLASLNPRPGVGAAVQSLHSPISRPSAPSKLEVARDRHPCGFQFVLKGSLTLLSPTSCPSFCPNPDPFDLRWNRSLPSQLP